MHFFTIGYGGRSPAQFLKLLTDAGVRTLIDVRLRPDRASMGSYSRARTSDKGIEALLAGAGIGYKSFIELGNLFRDQEDWPVQYARLMAQSGDLLVRRLFDLAEPFCLMCAEKRVEECHRRFIAEHLVAQGHRVSHL